MEKRGRIWDIPEPHLTEFLQGIEDLRDEEALGSYATEEGKLIIHKFSNTRYGYERIREDGSIMMASIDLEKL